MVKFLGDALGCESAVHTSSQRGTALPLAPWKIPTETHCGRAFGGISPLPPPHTQCARHKTLHSQLCYSKIFHLNFLCNLDFTALISHVGHFWPCRGHNYFFSLKHYIYKICSCWFSCALVLGCVLFYVYGDKGVDKNRLANETASLSDTTVGLGNKSNQVLNNTNTLIPSTGFHQKSLFSIGLYTMCCG